MEKDFNINVYAHIIYKYIHISINAPSLHSQLVVKWFKKEEKRKESDKFSIVLRKSNL